MTTSPRSSTPPSRSRKRDQPYLRTVPLSRLKVDQITADETARFADLRAAPRLIAVVTALRPPVVIPTDRPGWYQVLGNIEVVHWLRHTLFFGDDQHTGVPVLVMPPTMAKKKDVLAAASRYLIPLVFDELKDRAGRRAKRELKKAGLTDATHTLTANQRLKPVFHA